MAIARGIVLGSILWFTACGPVVEICTVSSCPTGCCNGSVCLDGNSDSACGVAGWKCTDCGSQGLVCASSGLCAVPPGGIVSTGGGTVSAGGGTVSAGGGYEGAGGGTSTEATGGGCSSTGGGTTSTGGGTASTGGGSASIGGGIASTGGGTTSTGGGTASTGGGSASTGGGIASTGGGTANAGGLTCTTRFWYEDGDGTRHDQTSSTVSNLKIIPYGTGACLVDPAAQPLRGTCPGFHFRTCTPGFGYPTYSCGPYVGNSLIVSGGALWVDHGQATVSVAWEHHGLNNGTAPHWTTDCSGTALNPWGMVYDPPTTTAPPVACSQPALGVTGTGLTWTVSYPPSSAPDTVTGFWGSWVAIGNEIRNASSNWSVVNYVLQSKIHLFGCTGSEGWFAGGPGDLARLNGSTTTTFDGNAGPAIFSRAIWGVSSDDVWIVGDRTGLTNSTALHWNGTALIATAVTSGFEGVWGSSSSDVWAVGTVISHWNGAAWTTMLDHLPGGPIGRTFDLKDVWGTSASNVWVVGTSSSITGDRGLAMHWDGATWAETPIAASRLNSVFTTSPSEAWAVGDGIFRWDGTAWTRQPDPNLPAGFNLTVIRGTSPRSLQIGATITVLGAYKSAVLSLQ